MKKYIISLTILMLIGLCSTAYSTPVGDSWTPAPKTGTFSAVVECHPAITPLAPVYTFPTPFFASIVPVPTTAKITWNLVGPPNAYYTINFTQNLFNAGAELQGHWTVGDVTQPLSGVPSTLGSLLPGSPIDFQIQCDAAVPIRFVTTALVPGVTPGPKTFTVGVTVTATI